mgnify:CR=1 FL=1
MRAESPGLQVLDVHVSFFAGRGTRVYASYHANLSGAEEAIKSVQAIIFRAAQEPLLCLMLNRPSLHLRHLARRIIGASSEPERAARGLAVGWIARRFNSATRPTRLP